MRDATDLLEMARAEAGGDDLIIEVLNVHELVHQCVMAATRRHHLPSSTVVVTPSALDALVAVDRRRMERVVTNLLENGYRYGGGTVLVHVDASDDTVIVDVDDNGSGIAPADRTRVFERFYRADSSRSRTSGEGSGLGLSIVDAVMKALGGRVSVRSMEGAGCTFTLHFPLSEN